MIGQTLLSLQAALLEFYSGQCPSLHQHLTSCRAVLEDKSFIRAAPWYLVPVLMAHRILAQIVFTGTRVFGRAFAEAYKQAQASSAYAKEAGKGNTTGMNNLASSGLTLDEACKILNVKPPMGGITNMEAVMERFKKLFDLNEPKKGGSFYLQSKILRARERIEMEVREAERKMAAEKDLQEGWKPRMYKD